MIDTGKFATAAAIAPLSAPVLIVLLILVLNAPNAGLLAIPAFVAGVVISYFVFLVLGLPTLYFLRKRNALTGRNIVLSGIGAGALLGVFLQVFSTDLNELSASLRLWVVVVFALYGLLVSGSFVALSQSTADEHIV